MTLTQSALNPRLTKDRADAVRHHEVERARLDRRHAIPDTAEPVTDLMPPVDPDRTQLLPKVGPVSPGTRAAFEQQRAADVIDEQRAPYRVVHQPSSPHIGGLFIFGIAFVGLTAAWMFLGTPNLAHRWPSLVILAGISATVLLSGMRIDRVFRHLRNQPKGEHR